MEARSGRYGREIPEYTRRYDPRRPTFEKETFEEMASNRSKLYLKKESARLDLLFSGVEPVIRSMAASAKSVGTKLSIVLIPDEVQVDPMLFEVVRKRNGLELDDFDLDGPQRRILALCRDLEIQCLDLLPAFKKQARGLKLYQLQDTHWNLAGNQLAADLISDAILAWSTGDNPRPSMVRNAR
jgi:hypothetical protein